MTTTTRLIKGMYESRSGAFMSGQLFGLKRFQADDFCHNAGWFNAKSERLGFGDLSKDDLRRIADCLEEGELFIIVGEWDMFWTDKDGDDPKAPGTRFIVEHAHMIVAPKRVLQVKHYGEPLGSFNVDGLTIENINEVEASRMIAEAARVAS